MQHDWRVRAIVAGGDGVRLVKHIRELLMLMMMMLLLLLLLLLSFVREG